MYLSLRTVFTLLLMGMGLVGLMVTCAPAETRTTYPKTFFRSKSTLSYSTKTTAKYERIPAVNYEPTAPSVTTVASAYKAVTTVPTTTYRPEIAAQIKSKVIASYAKNTFFNSKSAVTLDKSTIAYKSTTEASVTAVSNPSVNPSSETNAQLLPAGKVKGGLYVNTFFKQKPKTSKATTGATIPQPQSASINQVKISEPVNEGDVKNTKKVLYTNTYFKAKPAIVPTQVPTLDKYIIQASSNDSSSEESSEETSGSDSTSESSEESSEEDGEDTSEEESEEEEEEEGEKEEEASVEDKEGEKMKEEGEKEDNKAVKEEESNNKADVKSIQKTTVILPPPAPIAKSIPIVHEKKNRKPVFLAFKKMRSKPSPA